MSQNNNKKEIVFLIVEEDPKWQKKIAEFLHVFGFKNTLVATDGTGAWHKLKRYNIDFVICNLKLKHMSGLALLKIMMSDELYCTIPFLMISDMVEKSEVLEAAKAGVSGFIVKPFNHEKFMAKVEGILYKEDDKIQEEIKGLFKLGKRYMEEELYDEALKIFNKILELNDEAEAYYHIGYIKQSQGNIDEAAEAFRRAVQLNTTFVKAFESLGHIYKKIGKTEESERSYEKAGDIYLKQEMLEEAEQVYLEANALNPNNINIFNSLGIIYRHKRMYKEAILQYKKALKVLPEDEHIHYNIARAYLEDRKIGPAKTHLEKALLINPEFNEAISILKAIGLGFKKPEKG